LLHPLHDSAFLQILNYIGLHTIYQPYSGTADVLSFVFSPVAGRLLCFVFRMRIISITHQCFSCCWAVLTWSQGLSDSHAVWPVRSWRCTRSWKGTEQGQLTQTHQRDIPYHTAPFWTVKLWGGLLLLGDWMDTSQQVVSNGTVHHSFCMFFYHCCYYSFTFCPIKLLLPQPISFCLFSSSLSRPTGDQWTAAWCWAACRVKPQQQKNDVDNLHKIPWAPVSHFSNIFLLEIYNSTVGCRMITARFHVKLKLVLYPCPPRQAHQGHHSTAHPANTCLEISALSWDKYILQLPQQSSYSLGRSAWFVQLPDFEPWSSSRRNRYQVGRLLPPGIQACVPGVVLTNHQEPQRPQSRGQWRSLRDPEQCIRVLEPGHWRPSTTAWGCQLSKQIHCSVTPGSPVIMWRSTLGEIPRQWNHAGGRTLLLFCLCSYSGTRFSVQTANKTKSFWAVFASQRRLSFGKECRGKAWHSTRRWRSWSASSAAWWLTFSFAQ